MINKLLENFIKKAKEIHGDRYDYSLVEYKNNKTKVKIICPKHGIFEQLPYNHINKKTICPKCSYNNRILSSNEIVNRFISVHGDRYDYSLVVYKNNKTKVKIICPEHGIFEQLSHNHIDGQGCPKCKYENSRISYTDFINKAKNKHGNKYDYSLVKFEKYSDKIKIICPVHGVFEQRLGSHLFGYGCKKCVFENPNLSDFLKYKRDVRNLTKKNKKKLLENWNGYDYYDNENIRDNFSLHSYHKNYPTIDHMKSIYYCFNNKISVEECASIDNLCITKRYINSSKNKKCNY